LKIYVKNETLKVFWTNCIFLS